MQPSTWTTAVLTILLAAPIARAEERLEPPDPRDEVDDVPAVVTYAPNLVSYYDAEGGDDAEKGDVPAVVEHAPALVSSFEGDAPAAAPAAGAIDDATITAEPAPPSAKADRAVLGRQPSAAEPEPAPLVLSDPQPALASEPMPAPAPAPGRNVEDAEASDASFDEWGEPGATPAGEPRFQAAAMMGVGASFDETPGGVNPLGFGFGLRGDFRLLPALAVGGRFIYSVGGSASLTTGEVAMSTWLLAAEASFVVPLRSVILQPGLALGLSARATAGRTAFVDGRSGGFVPGSDDDEDVGLYLAPGVALTVPLSTFSRDLEPFFFGGDARVGLVVGDRLSGSLEIMAQLGLRF